MEAEDLLYASGAPTAKFKSIGDFVKGVVCAKPETKQSTDIDGKPKFYDDGQPMWDVIITLQTDERDDAISDDDGRRRVYVSGKMLGAVKAALREAGARGSIEGGTLVIRYVGDGEATRKGYNAPKLYEAKFKVGKPGPAVDPLDL